jgi:hypothetical protein
MCKNYTGTLFSPQPTNKKQGEGRTLMMYAYFSDAFIGILHTSFIADTKL